MDPQEWSAEPEGIVRIGRDRAGSSNPFAVWIDDVRVARVDRGRSVAVPVRPGGVHRVQVRWNPWWSIFRGKDSEVLNLLLEPGQVIHLDCTTGGGFPGTILLTRFQGLHGTVRIRRSRSGSIFPLGVWIDDVHVDSLGAGRAVAVPVRPGAHRVQVRWDPGDVRLFGKQNSDVLDFLMEPGQIVHFDGTTEGRTARLSHAGSPSLSGPGLGEARVLEMRETERVEEWIGEDVRLIDNRTSPTPVTRSLKASREWARTVTMGENHGRTVNGAVGANLLWLSAKASIEAELQRTLSLSIGSTHLFEEEITITVPKRTAVQIVLRWKYVWQRGEARLMLPGGGVQTVPYQVVVSVTFDQAVRDVTNVPGS